MVTYLTPVAGPAMSVTPYELGLRTKEFNGVIGYLANSQPGSRDFLASLASEVTPLIPNARCHFEDKGETSARSGLPLNNQALEEISRSCQAAILAYGHCGGCTSATVRDGVALARLGIPLVVIVAPRFEAEARQVARSLGMPDVPVVVLPGPAIRLSEDERRLLAEKVANPVVAALANNQ
jgi:hypothetical protein